MSSRNRTGVGWSPGFTLIELLVVVAIIALLISILLPSMKDAREQARTVVCQSNNKQIYIGMRSYMEDFNGYLPYHIWSESAWGEASNDMAYKKDLWFYRLFPKYVGDGKVYQCPSDPFRGNFDYEAETPSGGPRSNTAVDSCGYGINYGLRHFDPTYDNDWQLYRIEGKSGPRRLDSTILMAEVGPDTSRKTQPLPGYPSSPGFNGEGLPWRDGGRLVWDDGKRGWLPGDWQTWLTARHRGYINMMSMDGAVKKVRTREMLRQPIRGLYRGLAGLPDCYGRLVSGGNTTYICPLCHVNENHYTFARDNLWWWYGPFPRP